MPVQNHGEFTPLCMKCGWWLELEMYGGGSTSRPEFLCDEIDHMNEVLKESEMEDNNKLQPQPDADADAFIKSITKLKVEPDDIIIITVKPQLVSQAQVVLGQMRMALKALGLNNRFTLMGEGIKLDAKSRDELIDQLIKDRQKAMYS